MALRGISPGCQFEAAAGSGRAAVEGDRVLVSGTTGSDYQTGAISSDVVEQTQRLFANQDAAPAEAGADFADVVQVRTCLTERDDIADVAPLLRHDLEDTARRGA